MDFDVFLSYTHADTDTMKQILAFLQDADLKVWYDQEQNEVGTSEWWANIENGIEKSCCYLMLMSKEAWESPAVQQELALAEQQGKKRLFALIRGEAPPDIRDKYLYFDFRRGNYADVDKLIAEIKKIARTVRDGLFEYHPPSFASMVVLFTLLETAEVFIKNLSQSATRDARKRRKKGTPDGPSGRATLLWVNASRTEMYIVAATEGFEERELRWRFRKGRGIAGSVWARHETDPDGYPEPINPRSISADEMRANWGFNDEQIELTQRIGTLISLPIYNDSLKEMVGILSIDTEKEIDWSQLDTSLKNIFDTGIKKLRRYIRDELDDTQPLSYRHYRNLRHILTAVRLVPPLTVKVRAAIFLVNKAATEPTDDDFLYMLIGSEHNLGMWTEEAAEEHFSQGQGIIGKAWKMGELHYEDREGQTLDKLMKEHKMTAAQAKLAVGVQSILAIPIPHPVKSEIIGVLVVDSSSPMRESRLNDDELHTRCQFFVEMIAKILTAPN